jgi:serine/threonine protein phosphatase PrpC
MIITNAAAKGSRSYQEDRHFISEHPEGTLLVVFDGHGGGEASHEAHHQFDSLFWDCFGPPFDVPTALRLSIRVLAKELEAYEEGTTLSAVYIPSDCKVAYTAVLGDSPILIHVCSAPLGHGDYIWTGPDHNVRSNPTERESAEKRGGFYDGVYLYQGNTNPYGDHAHGLQMARALGDSALRGVLSTEPEINTVPLGEGGFILVATDGLFDPGHRNFEASRRQVLALIADGADAQYLVDNAVARDTHDNVTAILVRL